jgi:hypothetical protein
MFQSQYIEKLLNVSQCFSIFSQFFWYFFDIFGQKWRLNLNFRPNFTLLIKNRKPHMHMGLNICLLWTIFCYLKKLTIFKKIPTLKILKSTLKHWKHWIKFNVEILNNIDIELSFNVNFFDIKNIESKSMSMLVQTLNEEVQAALVICGLFICDFVYMWLKNCLFSGTYPLIYGNPWSFYIRIHYMGAYFWSPYLSHITRSTHLYTVYFLRDFLFTVYSPTQSVTTNFIIVDIIVTKVRKSRKLLVTCYLYLAF